MTDVADILVTDRRQEQIELGKRGLDAQPQNLGAARAVRIAGKARVAPRMVRRVNVMEHFLSDHGYACTLCCTASSRESRRSHQPARTAASSRSTISRSAMMRVAALAFLQSQAALGYGVVAEHPRPDPLGDV